MILDQFSLTGRVALVTGGSRGLGQGLALALAEAGADVALLDRGSAQETVRQIEDLGRRAVTVECDLLGADADDLQGVVQSVVGSLGRLDILVNNAGIIRREPALEFSESSWDDVLDVNLRAVFFLSQAAARVMRDTGGGKIINVASMLSFQGGILVPSYTAAKSAVAGLTRALANEWSALGINVNAIAPGYMATDNTAPLRADEERAAAILGRIPAGRWGTPDDLQGIIVFLASQASAYVHGAIVPVDGGWLTR
ncbi:2-dehydro-3-deoxy-D-gluconate 5-dehydrogenase KduD [Cellulomonas sp. URHE0023]|uniref:2-dehydro-3-deoxy-D-gluconate 5-dehydrogenase KduD n=1 Tax=Cellulomonas sp. URHE0023 TaxID=1380354 RepID=UPI0004847A02|nr:2-dehydro-3-deoxy-D-gluconate 5-dehydrogenase KduD [Cellulomonas sp. URHE0023]